MADSVSEFTYPVCHGFPTLPCWIRVHTDPCLLGGRTRPGLYSSCSFSRTRALGWHCAPQNALTWLASLSRYHDTGCGHLGFVSPSPTLTPYLSHSLFPLPLQHTTGFIQHTTGSVQTTGKTSCEPQRPGLCTFSLHLPLSVIGLFLLMASPAFSGPGQC